MLYFNKLGRCDLTKFGQKNTFSKCLLVLFVYIYVHIHTLDRSTQIIGTFSHSFHPGRCTAAGYRRTRCRSRCTKPAALFLWGCPYMLCRRCRIYNTDTGIFSLKSASKVNFTTLSGHVWTFDEDLSLLNYNTGQTFSAVYLFIYPNVQ